MNRFFYTLQVVILVLFLKNATWTIGTFRNLYEYEIGKLQYGDLILRSSLTYNGKCYFSEAILFIILFNIMYKIKVVLYVSLQKKTRPTG